MGAGESETTADRSAAPRSVGEAVDRLTRRGYAGQFRAVAGPALRETASGVSFPPERLVVDDVYRFEGVSDPDDQAIVFALRSPDDAVRGTYAVAYGPAVGPHDAEVLRRLREPSRTDGGGAPPA